MPTFAAAPHRVAREEITRIVNSFSPPLPLAPSGPAPLEAALFREAMSRVAGAVHVIATAGPAGRAGLTATALTSLAAEPPELLVCLNQASRTAAVLSANGVFSVNTLGSRHQALAEVFAGRTDVHGAARFEHGEWQAGPEGQPLLKDALVRFTVRAIEIRPVATHLVIIGSVIAAELGPEQPGLVYARRAYHAV